MAYTSVMRTKCGVDIIYIPKVERLLKDDKRLAKFIDVSEIGNGTAEHLAGIIAAKEAFFKAMGVMPRFREVAIDYEVNGRPKLTVSPDFNKFTSCDVSISHDKDYAIGFVILELP